MASFEFYRGGIPGSAAAPLGVVEHLDVVKHIGPGQIPGLVDALADAPHS